jgi:hypothetical protein
MLEAEVFNCPMEKYLIHPRWHVKQDVTLHYDCTFFGCNPDSIRIDCKPDFVVKLMSLRTPTKILTPTGRSTRCINRGLIAFEESGLSSELFMIGVEGN